MREFAARASNWTLFARSALLRDLSVTASNWTSFALRCSGSTAVAHLSDESRNPRNARGWAEPVHLSDATGHGATGRAAISGSLRLRHLPLRKHAIRQRLHAEFRGDSDGLVVELAVSTTVPFGQLAFGVCQIKGTDQMALRISYQGARYLAILKSFDGGIKWYIRAYC